MSRTFSLIAVALMPLAAAGCMEVVVPDPVATCDDGLRNGTETDVDCGGECGVCDVLQACEVGQDCIHDVCDAGTCAEPTCDDGVLNGTEVDVDCAGDCERCEAGQACDTADDCQSGVCADSGCQPAACDDGVWNGIETDLDCGGDCAPCERFQACDDSDDCADTVCVEGICERALTVAGQTKEKGHLIGQYVSQQIVRLDFVAEPTVFDFDRAEITLPVSVDRSFVSTTFSSADPDTDVTVNGLQLLGASGHTYYQSIEPRYFGVIIGFDSEASAAAGLKALEGASLEDERVEILVIDHAL